MSTQQNNELAIPQRIRTTSRFLKRLTSLGMLLILAVSITLAVVPAWFDAIINQAFPALPMATEMTLLKRIGLLVLFALPVSAMLYGLWHVRLLLAAYERGEIFTMTAADHIRRIGLVMAIYALGSVIIYTLATVLLTYDNPVGERQLAVSLSSNTYLSLLLGGLLIVIGWVMREAARLADENQQFV